MLTLDLAVATHRPEGIARVAEMLLPPADGIRYVVSWQDHENAPLPDALERPDVIVLRYEGRGLSNNRNNALDHCTADIVLFSDDDLIYNPQGLKELREAYSNYPDADVITVRTEHEPLERFPAEPTVLHRRLPKGYFVTSFEISLRRSTAGTLRCCPEIGLGAPDIQSGEDELVLETAMRRGLKCLFLPISIGAHPHQSTGTKDRLTPGNIMGSGVVIALTYPLTACLRLPLKAWRISRAGRYGGIGALRWLVAGALKAPSIRRRNKSFLW